MIFPKQLFAIVQYSLSSTVLKLDIIALLHSFFILSSN